jgi:hypothetical protein
MPHLNDDNLMIVILRDEMDEGCHIGWSPKWIEKCKTDPTSVLKTMNALGMAMQTFSTILYESGEKMEMPPKGLVN